MADFVTHTLAVDSTLLRGNPGGDPHRRSLFVLSPEDVTDDVSLPCIWMFAGHAGTQGGFLVDEPWKEGFVARVSRLLRTGELPPVRFALPDLWNRFGGCQTLDSSATGPYERHLWEELKPLLEGRFRTTRHGCAGHSSGGYGALVQAMRHPEHVSAVACHAGDMAFELAYAADFPKAASRLAQEGGLAGFVRAFEAARRKQESRWYAAINVVAMAAAYSPDPSEPLGIALPFDPHTAERRDEVWQRWLALDPVRLADRPDLRAALSRLRLLYFDAGSRDEWNLHFGARQLARKLTRHGVAHTHEEFDDGHSGTAYRFDRSLPLLARALAG